MATSSPDHSGKSSGLARPRRRKNGRRGPRPASRIISVNHPTLGLMAFALDESAHEQILFSPDAQRRDRDATGPNTSAARTRMTERNLRADPIQPALKRSLGRLGSIKAKVVSLWRSSQADQQEITTDFDRPSTAKERTFAFSRPGTRGNGVCPATAEFMSVPYSSYDRPVSRRSSEHVTAEMICVLAPDLALHPSMANASAPVEDLHSDNSCATTSKFENWDSESEYSNDESSKTSYESARTSKGRKIGSKRATTYSIVSPVAAGVYDNRSTPESLRPRALAPSRSYSPSLASSARRIRARRQFTRPADTQLSTSSRPISFVPASVDMISPSLIEAQKDLERALTLLALEGTSNGKSRRGVAHKRKKRVVPLHLGKITVHTTEAVTGDTTPNSSRRASRLTSTRGNVDKELPPLPSPRRLPPPVPMKSLRRGETSRPQTSAGRQMPTPARSGTLKTHRPTLHIQTSPMQTVKSRSMPELTAVSPQQATFASAKTLKAESSEEPHPTVHSAQKCEQHIANQLRIEQFEPTVRQSQDIIEHILQSLSSFEDLFNTALVSKGFFKVFKQHEERLMRCVLWNQSPAAWEYVETVLLIQGDRFNAPSNPDQLASAYYQTYQESQRTLTSLKSLISVKCRSLLRPTTVHAISSSDDDKSRRIDSALWRIWTFCVTFGTSFERKAISAQMDWLKGSIVTPRLSTFPCNGVVAGNALADSPSSCSTAYDRYNLSAEEIYDMIELWDCCRSLVREIEGQIEYAREYGVFDNTDAKQGDVAAEEATLRAFLSHILTLGLEPVLNLASLILADEDRILPDGTNVYAACFATARDRGWMDWSSPSAGECRSIFLKEPLTRLYKDVIQAEIAADQRFKVDERKEVRRQRSQSFSRELPPSRQSVSAINSPLIQAMQLADERSILDWEPVYQKLMRVPSFISEASHTASFGTHPDMFEKEVVPSEGRSTPDTLVDHNVVLATKEIFELPAEMHQMLCSPTIRSPLELDIPLYITIDPSPLSPVAELGDTSVN